MKVFIRMYALLFILILPLPSCSKGDRAREKYNPFSSGFIWGISTDIYLKDIFPWRGIPLDERLGSMIACLKDLGVDWFSAHIIWNEVTPYINSPELDIKEVDRSMVEEYAFDDSRWYVYDLLVEHMDRANINLLLALGGSFTRMLPSVINSEGQSLPATPDNLGPSSYLANLYLHARAAVRRYHSRIRVWQLDTELNFDRGHLYFSGWRQGDLWLDRRFTTRVIDVLRKAVKEEDPGALTTTQILTDNPGWKEWIMAVEGHLDMLGLSGYPNYFCGEPVRGYDLGSRIKEALELGLDKPVLILMTGYPTTSIVPTCQGTFTYKNQAQWIDQAVRAAWESDAKGFFYFTLSDQDYSGHPSHLADAHECCFGLVGEGDKPKDGWGSYRSVIQELGKRNPGSFSPHESLSRH